MSIDNLPLNPSRLVNRNSQYYSLALTLINAYYIAGEIFPAILVLMSIYSGPDTNVTFSSSDAHPIITSTFHSVNSQDKPHAVEDKGKTKIYDDTL